MKKTTITIIVIVILIALAIISNQFGLFVIVGGTNCDAVFECVDADICCELFTTADSCVEITEAGNLLACVEQEVEVGRGYETATNTKTVELNTYDSNEIISNEITEGSTYDDVEDVGTSPDMMVDN